MIRIGGFSALQYHLSRQLDSNNSQRGKSSLPKHLAPTPVPKDTFTLCETINRYGRPPGIFTDTLRVDICNDRQKYKCAQVAFRIINVNPKFYRTINDQFCVACPELVFLELASCLPLERLIEVGNLLCGTYVVRSCDGQMRFGVHPLTTRRKIRTALDEMGPLKNIKMARLALKSVRDSSASPIESKLAVMFCLPVYRGGFGIPAVLNKCLAISKNARGTGKEEHRKPDFYWPKQKVALDYDSKEWHDDLERAQADALRRNALIAAGILAMTLRNENIKTCFSLETTVSQLYKMLGVRKRKITENALHIRKNVFDSLFDAGGFDPFSV